MGEVVFGGISMSQLMRIGGVNSMGEVVGHALYLYRQWVGLFWRICFMEALTKCLTLFHVFCYSLTSRRGVEQSGSSSGS